MNYCPKFTVIIPVYNVAAYLAKCIDSVLKQEFKQYEVILIDDGSTDESGTICDKFAEQDKRIVVIHQKNKGLSAARNIGIENAKGEYILFLDSDDYWHDSSALNIIYSRLNVSNADILSFNYMKFCDDVFEKPYFKQDTNMPLDKLEKNSLEYQVDHDLWIACAWNKVIKRELFYTLLYENVMPMDIRINEDVLMNYWLFKAADSAVYEDFCPYHYILRKDSAATSILNEHKLKDPVRVMRIIQQDSKDIPEVKEVVEERLTRQLIAISILSVKKQGELIRPFRKEIRNELRTKLKLILSNSYMSKSVKIRAGWVVLFPDSYCWFHTLYAKITGLDKKYKIE